MTGRASDLVMGVDIGGTNTRILIVDRDRRVISRTKHPTGQWASASGASAVDALAALLEEDRAKAESGGKALRAAAVGIPAPLDRTRETVLSVSFVPSIAHLRLPELLSRRLRVPVVMDKDTHYLLRRDLAWWGKPVGTAVGIYLGTGVGNALWLDGHFHLGSHGASGELGHTVWPGIGNLCPCGKRGCVETIVSGAALAGWMAGTNPSAPVGEAFARFGDHPFIDRFIKNFAMLAASEANVIDPEVLFLAGGVLMMPGFPQRRLMETIRENLRTPQPHDGMELVFSQEDDIAGAEGACLAALAELS